MKKHITIFAITFFFLSACAPATALPTETPTATATPPPTATPEPTRTPNPTPTLEPWLVSLPENVVSVEMDGELILGLNDQGKKVMEYDLETGEWATIAIKDVDEWKRQVAIDEMAKYGIQVDTSDDEAMRQAWLEYSKTILNQDFSGNVQAFHETWPITTHTGIGRVLDLKAVEVKSEYLRSNGISEAQVLLVAFPYTYGPTEVLAGVYQDGDYVRIINHYIPSESYKKHGAYMRITGPDDVESMKGQDVMIEIVSWRATRDWLESENPSSNWSHLLSASEMYYVMYDAKTQKERDVFSLLVFDPDYYVMRRSAVDVVKNRPEHLSSFTGSKVALSEMSYMLDTWYSIEDSWLIPMALGADASALGVK